MKTRPEWVKKLKLRAVEASANSYSPYSRFKVGAAVMDESGQIYLGCNVENASYGLTQCAERNAVNAAVAAGAKPGSMSALLIYIAGEQAWPPCGACRQVMHELMSKDSEVISCCDSDDLKIWTWDEYLPDPFEYPGRS